MQRAVIIGAIAATIMAVVSGSTSARAEASGRLTVFVAASLTEVFPAIDLGPRPKP